MSHKKTHEEFLQELIDLEFFEKFELAEGEKYITTRIPIYYYDKKYHNEFCQKPSTLLHHLKDAYERKYGIEIINKKKPIKLQEDNLKELQSKLKEKIKQSIKIAPSNSIKLKATEDTKRLKKELEKLHPNFIIDTTIRNSKRTKVKVICKDCGNWFFMEISTLRNGGNCKFCGDGESFNNKLLRNILGEKKPLNWDYEYSPDWANGRSYDGYFEYIDKKNKLYRIIIEMHGKQHYEEVSLTPLSLEEIQEIDRLKYEMAIKNGCKIIYVNCNTNSHKIIVSRTVKKLSKFFKIEEDILTRCLRNAERSLIPQVCDLYKKDKNITQKQIAEHFHINDVTVIEYLRRGNEMGICIFPDVSRTTKIDKNTKKVMAFDKKGKRIGPEFISCKKCAEWLSENTKFIIDSRRVSEQCQGLRDGYKNYDLVIRYVEDVDKKGNPLSYEFIKDKYNMSNRHEKIRKNSYENKKNHTQSKKEESKEIICFDLKGNKIKQYNNLSELVTMGEKDLGVIINTRITEIITGRKEFFKKYIFRYPEDTISLPNGTIKPLPYEQVKAKYQLKQQSKQQLKNQSK